MKPKHKIIVLLCVVAFIAATTAWRLDGKKEDSPGKLTLYGNVEIRDAQLAFKDQERISAMSVDEGDRVTQGQILAQLDTKCLQAATLFNPLRYITVALREIFLEGADLRFIWPQLWPLLTMSGATLPIAAWMFRRRSQ
jgi:hypothetical protein